MPGSRIPESVRESVAREVIETDTPYCEIRQKYGISSGSLWYILNERGLTQTRHPTLTREVIDTALSEVVETKRPVIEIAEKYGMHHCTLKRYMRREGIRRT